MNRGILTAVASIGIAQLLKVPIKKLETRQWDWSAVTQPGGMPSSHSAGVTSLATYVALERGVKTIDFAISAIFGLIVMYDAMGIRRHAGEIAIEVNELDVQMEKLAGKTPGVYHEKRKEKLKEVLGHQPAEVFWGSVLGVCLGAFSYVIKQRRG
ncbi:MAG: divergent PAP2 family protein [Firmicutes bacterium]|nr:divergent PAP2 family protein [Bacillota bacterium]